jgi:hypothetical protein
VAPTNKACWKCRKIVEAEWLCCPYCATRLRDTREPSLPQIERDIHFLKDLYSFGWYNRDLTAIVLYESVATVEHYYNPGRLDNHKPLVETSRAQKILRLKIFAEYIALLEAFGYLCIAIRERRKKSIPWTYINTDPQEVVQFYNQILSNPNPPSLHRLLKLPSLSQVQKAAVSHLDAIFPELEKIGDANGIYAPFIQNIRICAELYRDKSDLNVRIYNKIKHVFSIVEGQNWITWENPPDVAHATILVELNDTAQTISFDMAQEKADDEMANIRRVTEMGAELLAICIGLNELGILF